MIFRKLRGLDHVPYRVQGLMWFTCVNYDRQDRQTRALIRRLCRECGGDHEKALFELVTRENISIVWLEQTYYISAKTLYRRRQKFFERLYEERFRGRVPDLRENIPEEA